MRIKVSEARGFWGKLVGLMIGKDHVSQGLLIRTRWGIHTWGMKVPIDVVVLDGDNRVVTMRENQQPNRLYFWNPKDDRVIELPAGTIGKRRIEVGNKISVKA